MLEIKDLTYEVEDNGKKLTIIDRLNLTVGDGKFVVITGPNGGGKSSLAKLIMGVNPITSGKIILDGEDITDKNITEDFATVSGAIFGYGPVLLPVSFVVRNTMGMNYFEGLDASPSNPTFTKVWGRINCMTIKTEKKEESAFGEAAVQTYERKSREYVITGTAKVPYDFGDEETLTAADVNKMIQDRQVKLAEIEKRFNERQTSAKATNGVNFGATTATTTVQSAIPSGKFKF